MLSCFNEVSSRVAVYELKIHFVRTRFGNALNHVTNLEYLFIQNDSLTLEWNDQYVRDLGGKPGVGSFLLCTCCVDPTKFVSAQELHQFIQQALCEKNMFPSRGIVSDYLDVKYTKDVSITKLDPSNRLRLKMSKTDSTEYNSFIDQQPILNQSFLSQSEYNSRQDSTCCSHFQHINQKYSNLNVLNNQSPSQKLIDSKDQAQTKNQSIQENLQKSNTLQFTGKQIYGGESSVEQNQVKLNESDSHQEGKEGTISVDKSEQNRQNDHNLQDYSSENSKKLMKQYKFDGKDDQLKDNEDSFSSEDVIQNDDNYFRRKNDSNEEDENENNNKYEEDDSQGDDKEDYNNKEDGDNEKEYDREKEESNENNCEDKENYCDDDPYYQEVKDKRVFQNSQEQKDLSIQQFNMSDPNNQQIRQINNISNHQYISICTEINQMKSKIVLLESDMQFQVSQNSSLQDTIKSLQEQNESHIQTINNIQTQNQFGSFISQLSFILNEQNTKNSESLSKLGNIEEAKFETDSNTQFSSSLRSFLSEKQDTRDEKILSLEHKLIDATSEVKILKEQLSEMNDIKKNTQLILQLLQPGFLS